MFESHSQCFRMAARPNLQSQLVNMLRVRSEAQESTFLMNRSLRIKGYVHPKLKSSYYLLILVLIERRVKFCSPQNCSEASQQNSVLLNN